MNAKRGWHWLLAALVLVALAGQPNINSLRAASPPTDSPSVLGWSPGASRNISPAAPISITFNRSMDHSSVEQAWRLAPSAAGRFRWSGTTLTFDLLRPLRSGAHYHLSISQIARDVGGSPLGAQFSVAFATGDPLRVQSYTPWNGTKQVSVNGLVAITFNHPMVALAGLSTPPQEPAGWNISIRPTIAGRGSWLGTSTWVFHPATSFQPSTVYTVSLGKGAQDSWGDALGAGLRWSFRTLTPAIVARSPGPRNFRANPSGAIAVRFNQPMDHASTQAAFSLTALGRRIPGSFAWKGNNLVFQPSARLNPNVDLVVTVASSARSFNWRSTLGKSVQWRFGVAPSPRVAETSPNQNGTYYPDAPPDDSPPGVVLYFSAPMRKASLDRHISIVPSVSNLYTGLDSQYGSRDAYFINGDFQPSTAYTVTIKPGVTDSYGRPLPPYTLHFKTSRLTPSIALYGMPGAQQGISFSAGRVVAAPVQFVNIPRVHYTLIRTTLASLLSSEYGRPTGKTVREWTVDVPHPLNTVKNLTVDVAGAAGTPLKPGMYWLDAQAEGKVPGLSPLSAQPESAEMIAVTNVNLTAKSGGNGILTWVNDAATGGPLPGARVTLMDYQGDTVTSGVTGASGIHFFHSPPRNWMAAGVDDGVHFGIAENFWSPNVSFPGPPPTVSGDAFGYAPYSPPPFNGSGGTYLYTDRPVYRPGQRVHFRGVLWRNQDSVYSRFRPQSVNVWATDSRGHSVYRSSLTLDRFGAVAGTFTLPPNVATGDAQMGVNLAQSVWANASFTVANYRKPEFLTSVTSLRGFFTPHQTVRARVNVRYVFDAPVIGQSVSWIACGQPAFLPPPGWNSYQFANWDDAVSTPVPAAPFRPPSGPECAFGDTLAQGTGTTDRSGNLTVRFTAPKWTEPGDRTVTVEVTATDVNRQSVSGRVQIPLHKASIAIGLSAQHQVIPVASPATVDIVAVRHDGTPLPSQPLTATVYRRTFTSRLRSNGSFTYWQSVPHDTVVDTHHLTTDAGGRAQLTFTPTDGGSYYVAVESTDPNGNVARTTLTIDVSAAGFSDWGRTDSTTVTLKPDKTVYHVGDVAHILVPLPFDNASALVTVERGTIRRYHVQRLTTNSGTVDIPITLTDLPNIYVTVSAYHGWRGPDAPDWKYGAVELHVSVNPRSLIVHLSQSGKRHRPGEPVTYTVTTTDAAGRPVSAELSLALVDTSVLALQDQRSPDIMQAFYAEQPLGVSTSSDGVISVDHLQSQPDTPVRGIQYGSLNPAPPPAPTQAKTGGGGGGCCPNAVIVRSHFPDTARWIGSLITDGSGHGTLHVRLPDSVTTWKLDARGITTGQRVGQGSLQTVSTKDLLLRPLTPRFFLQGDTVRIGAVVNNTRSTPEGARLSISAFGLSVVHPRPELVQISPHGERLALWTVHVPPGHAVRITIFAASLTPGVAGDAVRVTLPIHPPLTDETVASSGEVLAGARQYLIVPPHAALRPGSLTVQISTAIVAGLGDTLPSFRPQQYESNDDTALRVLVASTLRTLPVSLTGLSRSSHGSLAPTVNHGVQRLLANQFGDGGWPWFNDPWAQSDPMITADAVQAIAASGWHGPRIRQAMAQARAYLHRNLSMVTPSQRAHLFLVLARSGGVPQHGPQAMYENSFLRTRLDPAGLADLAWALNGSGNRAAATSLISALDSQAMVSATGAHWEGSEWSYGAEGAITATTRVLAALVALAPHDAFVAPAARWLMLARQGTGWDCSSDTAQAVVALASYARAAREGRSAYRYRVMVDNRVRLAGTYTRATQRVTSTARVPVAQLARRGFVNIERVPQNGTLGPGPLYYLSRLRYYLPAQSIGPRNQGIAVSRRYLDLNDHPISVIRAGTGLKVELTIRTNQTLMYLYVQDPIPSGLEPVDESLKTSQKRFYAAPPFTPWDSTEDISWYLSHADLRDDRVALYATSLPPGTYTYTYLAQATTSGRYNVAPTHAAETFFPEVFGRSAGSTFVVR